MPAMTDAYLRLYRSLLSRASTAHREFSEVRA
jgi:hypothetical protein